MLHPTRQPIGSPRLLERGRVQGLLGIGFKNQYDDEPCQSIQKSFNIIQSFLSNMRQILRPPRRPVSLRGQEKHGPKALVDEISARWTIEKDYRVCGQGLCKNPEELKN